MVNVQELQHKQVPEIIRLLGVRTKGYASCDIKEMGRALEVSVISYNLSTVLQLGEKILCAFVTKDTGRKCIFYNVELETNEARVIIVRAFARYIMTGDKNFCITESTVFSKRENSFVYEFLMPEDEVHDVLDKLILPTTFSLANIFDVTQEFVKERLDAMRERLKRLIGNYDF